MAEDTPAKAQTKQPQGRPAGPNQPSQRPSAQGATQRPAPQQGSRPPGEVGGHTVQPWEQESPPKLGQMKHGVSKDVPFPEAGAPEARRGVGQGDARTPGPPTPRTPGTLGASAMKPSGVGNQPHSRTQATQAQAATPRAAATVTKRSGPSASGAPEDSEASDDAGAED